MEKLIAVCVTFATVIILGLFICGTTYYCNNSNRAYYDSVNKCVESGGSFVPTSASNGSGFVCIIKNK